MLLGLKRACLRQALHRELAALDQDTVDTSSLDAVKKELISPGLLLGKDRGVQAHVACCLADLLRLYAPDAPYTPSELKVHSETISHLAVHSLHTHFRAFLRAFRHNTGHISVLCQAAQIPYWTAMSKLSRILLSNREPLERQVRRPGLRCTRCRTAGYRSLQAVL